MRRITCFSFLWSFLVFLLVSSPAQARPAHLFKVASLAPQGSIWANRFNDFAREVFDKSGGQIGFKAYPGGVMGDDRAIYRKMKIGQLHGAGFTMSGISEVVPDFRVMGIPFLLSSYAEVDHLYAGLNPLFQKAFADKGLVLLAATEVGFVHTMSVTPWTSLSDLKKSRSWVPSGDALSLTFLETMGVAPVTLAIPDVLPALQTGMIDTVFNSYYGSIVLQWFTRINYVSDIPFGYAYGAFVLDRKKFDRLSDEQAVLVRQAADKHFRLLLEDTRKSNEESLQVLLDNGVKVAALADGDENDLLKLYDKVVERMTGKVFSRKIYQEAVKQLAEYRKANNKAGGIH